MTDQTATRPGKTTDLTTAAIGPALLLCALPTPGSSVLQSANGSIDAVWVGRLRSWLLLRTAAFCPCAL